MKKFSMLMLILVAAFAVGSVSAQVANGSFETGTDPGGYTTVFAGNTNIDGWTVDFGSVDYIGSYWLASNGGRSIDMNGEYQQGQISQTFASVPGVTYLVSFYMSGNPDHGIGTKNMSVRATGLGASLESFTYDVTALNSHADMQWALKTYTFAASGSSTTLSFASEMPTPEAWGPALDNVTVTAISASRVCHRDNGKPGAKTLTVGASAVAAHLAHGDTVGPCPATTSANSK